MIRISKNSNAENRYLSKQALYELMLLQDAQDDALSVHFAKYGLTAAKFNVLVHLYMSGGYGLIQSEISKKMLVSRANITGLLERMEKEGFVVRKTDSSDKRVFRVFLTDRATCLIHTFLPLHNEFIHKLMSPLDRDEKETMIALLKKIRQGIETLE